MPFKEFDSIDKIPQDQRDKAIERKDGKFIVEEPVDIAALKAEGKKAIDAERERAEAAERERNDLKKKLEAKERDEKAAGKGVTAEELERLRTEDAEKRKPLEDRIAGLEKENRTLKLDDRVRQIGLDKGIMKTRVAKAMKDLEGRFELDKDGKIIVKDAEGKATTQTVEEFFEKAYKEEAPFFYEGVNSSGSGADGGTGGSGSAYDPVAAGKKAAEQQKKGAGENALAFK